MKINQLWNINFWGHKFQIKYCWKRMYDGQWYPSILPKRLDYKIDYRFCMSHPTKGTSS
jgi:hypothetical protein